MLLVEPGYECVCCWWSQAMIVCVIGGAKAMIVLLLVEPGYDCVVVGGARL